MVYMFIVLGVRNVFFPTAYHVYAKFLRTVYEPLVPKMLQLLSKDSAKQGGPIDHGLR